MASRRYLGDPAQFLADLGLTGLARQLPSSVRLTGGTIDGVSIGSSVAGAGVFSSLSSPLAQITSATISGGSINGTAIGASNPSTAAFTSATVGSTLAVAGKSTLAALAASGLISSSVGIEATGFLPNTGQGTSNGVHLSFDPSTNTGYLTSVLAGTAWRTLNINAAVINLNGNGNPVNVNGGPFTVSGATTLSSTLSVAGAATFGGIINLPNGAGIGGVSTGFYADGSNVALRTYSGASIYFQGAGGATWNYINASNSVQSVPAIFQSNVTISGTTAHSGTATFASDPQANGGSISPQMKALLTTTGGGTITFDASANFSWSARFICMNAGNSSLFSTNGYFDISMPASGSVVTGYNGASSYTMTSSATIPIGNWQTLYYILPIGSSNATINSNFALVAYGSGSFVVPAHWLPLATRNNDSNRLYVMGGRYILAPGDSLDTAQFRPGIYTAGNYAVGGSLTVSGNNRLYLRGSSSGVFQIFDDTNAHLESDTLLWINQLTANPVTICAGGGLTTVGAGLNVGGTVTAPTFASTANTGVALQMGPNSAIRDNSNGGSTMYFDISTGGTAQGQWMWRSTNGYTQRMLLDTGANLYVAGNLNTPAALVVAGNTVVNGNQVYVNSGPLYLGNAGSGNVSISNSGGTTTILNNLTINGPQIYQSAQSPRNFYIHAGDGGVRAYMGTTYQAMWFGFDNPTGTNQAGVNSGACNNYFAITQSGVVGSVTNTGFANGFPTFRNTLDNGGGSATIAANLTVSGGNISVQGNVNINSNQVWTNGGALYLQYNNGSGGVNICAQGGTTSVGGLLSANGGLNVGGSLNAARVDLSSNLTMYDAGGRNYWAGIVTEAQSQLIDFAINADQIGPANGNAQGGFFRLDARNGQALFQWNANYGRSNIATLDGGGTLSLNANLNICTSVAGSFRLYNDGNGHIETNTPLWLQYASANDVHLCNGGGTTYTNNLNTNGTISLTNYVSTTKGGAQFLAPGYMHYSDGANFYILLTGSGSPTPNFNGLRPFNINLSNGRVGMQNGCDLSGGFNVDTVTASNQFVGPNSPKAWVVFDQAGNIIAAHNVSSISASGNNTYTINFPGGTFPDANYGYCTGSQTDNNAALEGLVRVSGGTKSATQIQFYHLYSGGGTGGNKEMTAVFYHR